MMYLSIMDVKGGPIEATETAVSQAAIDVIQSLSRVTTRAPSNS